MKNLISLRKNNLLTISFTLTFLSLAGLLVSFILNTVEITKQSSLIRETQKNITELSQENRNLKTDLLSSNFFKNSEILAAETYEKVGKIHYIKILGDTSIAKKTQP
ncbi:MAG: hypothetical protein ABH919_02885 [bacterium]